ncbi:MAG: nicotinate-nucleotide--dimethylbenzimidazole phosphoribosyltransferase, partial [Desulfurococcales archaeon]|nr:nicotinate-nucleotide--dimethylbenzimidazole phosphoribosyltransferase [Desulfurococcales archaeon]
PVIATKFSFQGTRHRGLRAYDEGFVKEGVGAGGALVLGVAHGLGLGELRRLIEEEYERVLGKGKA